MYKISNKTRASIALYFLYCIAECSILQSEVMDFHAAQTIELWITNNDVSVRNKPRRDNPSPPFPFSHIHICRRDRSSRITEIERKRARRKRCSRVA